MELDIENYNWYETPVDAKTGEAATADSKYVFFGVFPRTVLPNDSEVTIDEKDSVVMGKNTYCRGSDGEYYAKVTEEPYGDGFFGDEVYEYSDGSKVKSGNYRYFKVKPIKWKVLTSDYNGTKKALLLAVDILVGNVPYYEAFYEDGDGDRTIDGKTVYPNNYMHSQIRAYLNGLAYQGESGENNFWKDRGFLQTAFTEAAQTKIAITEVDNSGESTTDAAGKEIKADGSNPDYPTDYTCENTKDKIFLLSLKEITTWSYGFFDYCSRDDVDEYEYDDDYEYDEADDAKIRFSTDYATATYAYQGDGYGGMWWLRTPSYDGSYNVCDIIDDGFNDRFNCDDVIRGVVPALTISL